ncbi:hypothetical protein GKA54_07480 [Vibrio parahaemolyticus]|nr:hypothetical protein [Vibrio parahaemolyticus]EGQ8337109.1 hypothetical protein [Vibrio parahaemolyticus]EGQ8370641.1 hypothetical protein [Vibrio parahaemolyticus]EGQ8722574.1 hypothetical protein [Vibrio parahaemolyticus]EGQ8760412.1 hypothetical protein [Vibrio parahaemolyticus]
MLVTLLRNFYGSRQKWKQKDGFVNGKFFGQLFFVLQLVMLVLNSSSSVISAWTQKQKTT